MQVRNTTQLTEINLQQDAGIKKKGSCTGMSRRCKVISIKLWSDYYNHNSYAQICSSSIGSKCPFNTLHAWNEFIVQSLFSLVIIQIWSLSTETQTKDSPGEEFSFTPFLSWWSTGNGKIWTQTQISSPNSINHSNRKRPKTMGPQISLLLQKPGKSQPRFHLPSTRWHLVCSVLPNSCKNKPRSTTQMQEPARQGKR